MRLDVVQCITWKSTQRLCIFDVMDTACSSIHLMQEACRREFCQTPAPKTKNAGMSADVSR